MKYDSFRYYFPPRPIIKSLVSGLDTYERMGFIGQPKLNGSCAMLYTGLTEMRFMNRHNENFSRNLIPNEDLLKLHRGSGPMILCGDGKIFNGCFVLFDILVHKGIYLTGTTFLQRQELLETLFPGNSYDSYLFEVSKNVYRVKNFTSGFKTIYNKIITIDIYEGFVCKKGTGILEAGYRPNNNQEWQVKIRKSTKNYSY